MHGTLRPSRRMHRQDREEWGCIEAENGLKIIKDKTYYNLWYD